MSGGVDFPYASGFDCEAVYAPWDHIATYAAFQFDRFSGLAWAGEAPANPQNYNNRFGEIGLGYYDTIHWAHYEAYLLAGLGTGSDQISYVRYNSPYSSSSGYTDTTSLHVFRLGIQQNIGIGGSDGASGGVGLGIGYERLYSLSRNVTNYEFIQYDSAQISSAHETSSQFAFYAEPIIFLSTGGPVAFNGLEFCRLHFLFEFWWTYRTNSYPSFGDENASLTLSLDF